MIFTAISFITGSKLGRYVGFALAMVGPVLMFMLYVARRDKRLIARDRLKSNYVRQKKLNVIHKNQSDIAANRVSSDDIARELRDNDEEF